MKPSKNAFALTALAAAGATVIGLGGTVWAQLQSSKAAEPRSVTQRGPLLNQEQSLVSLFEQAAPSVAYITTERLQVNFWMEQSVAQGAGSGFVWDREGHIITNFHVVEGAQRVQVQLDAGKPIPGEVIGKAPEYDLAVIKLKQVPKDLRPIPLGASADLKIGQSVIAIGNPFGLKRTLTTGIISSLDRHIPSLDDSREITGVIQTDAAINPGNSGGPLLDSAGRLIGVNSQIVSRSGSSAGVGFSIPSDTVNRIVPQLISRGFAARPGIGISAVDESIVARIGVRGVSIQNVGRATPASEAGLEAWRPRVGLLGDTITAVNGKAVESLADLSAEFDRAGINTTVELTVKKGNPPDWKERKVRVKVIDVTTLRR
jgi:2-alkenal reductase